MRRTTKGKLRKGRAGCHAASKGRGGRACAGRVGDQGPLSWAPVNRNLPGQWTEAELLGTRRYRYAPSPRGAAGWEV